MIYIITRCKASISRFKRRHGNKSGERGATLVEALISVALVSLILVSILSGFAQQQTTTRRNSDKNTAILLGEARLEELLKFPADQLQAESYVDYVVQKLSTFEVYNENATPPNMARQYRRTTTISLDPKGQLAYIRVVVEYGRTKKSVGSISDWVYPYQVGFSTKRMLR